METIYNNSSTVPIDNVTAGLLLTIFSGFLLFFLIILLAIYIYMAICLMKIAKKTGTANAWFAWIPILNIILIIHCAQKPFWWIILFFIPFVNIVAGVMLWMALAKNLGKQEWLGILMIIPIVNLIMIGYLAFSKNGSVISTAPTMTPPINPI